MAPHAASQQTKALVTILDRWHELVADVLKAEFREATRVLITFTSGYEPDEALESASVEIGIRLLYRYLQPTCFCAVKL